MGPVVALMMPIVTTSSAYAGTPPKHAAMANAAASVDLYLVILLHPLGYFCGRHGIGTGITLHFPDAMAGHVAIGWRYSRASKRAVEADAVARRAGHGAGCACNDGLHDLRPQGSRWHWKANG
ncbi:exported hypothetical protein [Hyphomicrobiales bacterium]|nr:exported hypothetical protein [Hyphomicrobiales bacterium]CAH1690110.1 exported hypothetical protein [Hyphomicrobiales bacterium]